MSADDQRAADDGWTPIPETAACPAECEDCQVTVDRLRTELAETRTVGDALAAGVTTWLAQGPDGPMGKTMLCPLVDMWTEVRGDAPAPPAARCRCGVQRGTEHLRNCRERCQNCGGDPDGPRRCACVEAPAAGRDLTAQDVRDALLSWDEDGDVPKARHVADRLNEVARPAVARTDGQDPTAHAHVWRLHRNVTSKGHVLPAYEACWCGAARSVPASATSAAPADDTACALCGREALSGYVATPDVAGGRRLCHRTVSSCFVAWTRDGKRPAEQAPADDAAAPDGPTADEAVASAARIVEAWAHLRMDTPEDQATHDELVRVSRATIAAYVRTRPWSSAGQPVRGSQTEAES